MRKSFADTTGNNHSNEQPNAEPRIFLALQGGGSHGAFTAGVIEALQEADLLRHVKGVSGTSAGAFNAAPLSYALNLGKPELAPKLINKAWATVAQNSATMSMMHSFARATATVMPFMMPPARYPNLPRPHAGNLTQAGHLAQAFGIISQSGDIKSRMREIIPNWDVINKGKIETIVAATEIVYSHGRKYMAETLFRNGDIDADAIAASATLIGTHRKNGKDYVDGGYTNNPPLQAGTTGDYTDILAIMLSEEPDAPLIPSKQEDQVNGRDFLQDEVYNELAAIHLNHQEKNLHAICMKHEPHWDETSKLNSERKWIADLHDRGYAAGVDWIAKNAHKLGKQSSYTPKIRDSYDYQLDKPDCAVA